MLHHALGLRLAQVLVGGGEATGRQHHSGGLCGGRKVKGAEFFTAAGSHLQGLQGKDFFEHQEKDKTQS